MYNEIPFEMTWKTCNNGAAEFASSDGTTMRRTSKLTVHDLLSSKGQKTWVQLHVDTPAEAAAAEAAGIHVLSCEPDHTLEAIRRAAPLAMISAGMPHGAVASPVEAVRYGFAVLKRGADAVYTSH